MANSASDGVLVFFHGPFLEEEGDQFVYDVGVYLTFISFLHNALSS